MLDFTIVMIKVKQITCTFLRHHWREIMGEMVEGKTRYIILRYGKPIAVILPIGEYEAIKKLHDMERKARELES